MNFSHIKTLASGNVLVKFQFSAVIMAKITHIFACVKILVPNPVLSDLRPRYVVENNWGKTRQ